MLPFWKAGFAKSVLFWWLVFRLGQTRVVLVTDAPAGAPCCPVALLEVLIRLGHIVHKVVGVTVGAPRCPVRTLVSARPRQCCFGDWCPCYCPVLPLSELRSGGTNL